MITISMLWLPIVLSAVAVFIASSVMWMLAPHHKGDWRGFSNEAAVADALRAGGAAPGQYMLPHHGYDRNAMKSPEFQQKLTTGPVAYVTVGPNGPPPMAVNMIWTFLVTLFVSLVVGYIGHWTLRQGIDSGRIWRVIGASALLGYTTGGLANAIWFQTPRSTMAKNIFDGIVYAAITAAIFCWLWPA